ncbi:MAG: hypothetical protein ACRD4Q_09780, partial [Candidatus Acidiferrales bacterium]
STRRARSGHRRSRTSRPLGAFPGISASAQYSGYKHLGQRSDWIRRSAGLFVSLLAFWTFTLISSEQQLEEFRRVTRYPSIQKYLRPSAAGTMLNEIRALAEFIGPAPEVRLCVDPGDNFLLGMAGVR